MFHVINYFNIFTQKNENKNIEEKILFIINILTTNELK